MKRRIPPVTVFLLAPLAHGQPIVPERIAYPGDLLPAREAELIDVENAVQSPDGRKVVLRANVLEKSGYNTFGLWYTEIGGEMELVAAQHMEAPGTEPGTEFVSYTYTLRRFVVSSEGRVLFQGQVDGPSVTKTNQYGIWAWQDGVLKKVMRHGDPVPGFPPDIKFGRDPSLARTEATLIGRTDDGEFGYFVDIHGPGITQANDRTIWLTKAGEPRLVLREGDAAPGAGDIFRLLWAPTLGAGGEIAVTGSVTGFSEDGIWYVDTGEVQPLALWGEPAPDLPGISYGELSREPLVSVTGEVLFMAQLRGSGVTVTNDTAVFRGRPGAVELIIREGDPAPGLPGAFLPTFPAAIGPNGDAIVAAGVTSIGSVLWRFPAASSPRLLAMEDDPTPGGSGVHVGWTGAPRVEVSRSGVFVTLPYRDGSSSLNGLFYFPFEGDPFHVLPRGQVIEVQPGIMDAIRVAYQLDRVLETSMQNLDLSVDGIATVGIGFQTLHENGVYQIHIDTCAADCDGSGTLDIFDFLCFQNLFALGDPAADCDGSGVLDIFDFLCFQNAFGAGCP
ncbi:MAG: choice-of-anchor tandem repeat NxxGxxAF-containing protein [Phycisphaerales bacterium JB039]